jgi:hypothetical protein
LACLIVGTLGEYSRLKLQNKEKEIKEDDVIFDLLYNGFAVKHQQ